jgi:glutathione S-transferase
MITVYKFGQIGDVSDPSPFCVKVEAYLRIAGLPYTTNSGALYLRKSPKGKLPYITDGDKIIADSSFILLYLKKTYGDKVDNHLTVTEKAVSHAFCKMIDENLYWAGVHGRWKPAHNMPAMKKQFFGNIPFPLNSIILRNARNNVLQALYKQGMGRHSDEEILEAGERDLKALSDFLADKQYFFGDQPCSLDATAYGILSQMIRVPHFTAPINEKAKTCKNLVDFTNRFHEKYFNDLAELPQ